MSLVRSGGGAAGGAADRAPDGAPDGASGPASGRASGRASDRASDRASGRAPRTIALVGAECTGKTSLAVALAEELGGLWLPEALREFCDREGRTPRPDEQAALMREQIAREAQAVDRARREGVSWVVCDSTPLVTALYSVMLFGDRSLLGPALDHQRRHALTLLADTDLPWTPDGIQRDGPRVRAEFHRLLVATLGEHGIAHRTVSGLSASRLDAALRAVRGCV